MALFEITYFSILWSNLLEWGYQCTLPLYHPFVIDMVIAMEHGIPASSESRFIHAVNKASSEQRRGWGFHAYERPTGPQQISKSRFIHAVNKASYERNLRRWEERNVEARSEATLRVNERGQAKEALSTTHYHLPMHCTLRYGT